MGIEYLNNKQFEANILKYKQSKQDKIRYEMILSDLNDSTRECLLSKKKEEYTGVLHIFNESAKQLAADFFKIAEGIISYRRFHFVEPDDAVQEFVMICFDKIDRFDPEKGKAFNYMTTCILNHYRQLYRTARNQNELKRKYHDFLQVKNANISVKARSTSIAKDKFTKYN